MNKFSGLATTDADKFFLDEVVDWFYSLTSSVDTEGEMIDSLSKLKVYIRKSSKDSSITKALVEVTAKYLRESFEPDLHRLCQYYYCSIPHGYEAANSFSESSNSMMYRSGGVKANNKLNITARKICKLSDKRYNTMESTSTLGLNKTEVARGGKSSLGSEESTLTKHIVDHAAEGALQQHSLSSNYHVCVKPSSSIVIEVLVRQENPAFEYDHIHPVYSKTHKVSFTKTNDGLHYCVKCDKCEHFHVHKFPCRHVYRVLDRKPVVGDFYPECSRLYENCYAEPGKTFFDYNMTNDKILF